MVNWFLNLNYVLQALLATIFTWSITSLGASVVFFFKKVNKNIMDGMLGFSAGVMLSASFWSLLSPSIEISNNLKMNPWITATIGILMGSILLFIGNKIFNLYNNKKKIKKSNSFKRCLMLIFSITLQNIPEGLAIGVTFGSLAYSLNGATTLSACMLALGVGFKNFPEGAAVSIPLRREGLSRNKAFFYGVLNGIVEPIASVIGALLVIKVKYLLPYFLAFAAGAIIYVAVEELIPESQNNKRKDLITFLTLIGFTIMMILDIAL